MEDTVNFVNRKGLLIFFGILLIAAGGISSLFALLTIFSIIMQQAGAGLNQQIPTSSALLGTLMYIATAAVFITLGIGSIQAKRWARSLILLISWLILLTGVIGLVFMLFYARNILEQVGEAIDGDPYILNSVLIILYGMITVFFIVIPGTFILVYQSSSVIQTVQKYDCKERWTDKCPLPLLMLCFFFLYTAIIPLLLLFFGFVAPFFGMLLYGFPAAVLWFADSILCVYLAIRIYRLDIRAWYYSLFWFLLWMVSTFITLLYNDYTDVYEHMNYPPEQVALLKNMKYLSNNNMLILIVLTFVSYLIFFFYAQKYFRKKE